MNILIPIETSSRELLYKVRLCQLLASKGFNCYLGRKTQINFLINSFSHYIYLDKGYHLGQSDQLYEVIKRRSGIIVSLDEEGGVDFLDNTTLLTRYAKSFFEQADFVFMWGSKQKELVKSNLIKSSQVEVTGHPRFELLKSNFHYLYEDEVSKLKSEYGDFILINTNMGFGNNIKGDDFVRSNYGSRISNIRKIIDFDKEKLKVYIELVKELARVKGSKIVFRPHPEECHKTYLREFSDLENVSVVYSGSVIPWLLAAEKIIHPDCTTAIEAMFLGKQACSFLPKNYPRDLVTHLPISASTLCSNFNEVSDFIANNNMEVSEDSYNLVDSYFSIELASFEIIVARLVSIKNIFGLNTSKLLWWDRIFLKLKALRSQLSQTQEQQLVNNKLQDFNWKSVSETSGAIEAQNVSENKVKIRAISNQLFVFLSSKN